MPPVVGAAVAPPAVASNPVAWYEKAIDIDRGKLYFTCLPDGYTPVSPSADSVGGDHETRHAVLFCGTAEYVYQHFFADFGPLHLGHVYAFCTKLRRMLVTEDQEAAVEGSLRRPVYICSSDHPHRRSNAAVLVVAFSVLDCARAIARAAGLRHLDLQAFNPDDYAFYDKIENGDLNWIVPGKFLAFSGPLPTRREVEPGKCTLLAQDYVPIFHKLGVTCVIRFNKRCYDRRRITEGGIKHVDLFYEDGGNPTDDILQRFLRICEDTKGAIAVHCKAGLGRTGTNIALFMMKHYGYSAAETIALCRICRPGSIVGPQQQFLHDLEQRMKRDGENYRKQTSGRRYGVDRTGFSSSTGRDWGVRGAPARSIVGRAGPSSALPAHGHRPQRSYIEADTFSRSRGRGNDGDGRLATGSRPTTSPLVLRRHSTSAGIGGGRGRGSRTRVANEMETLGQGSFSGRGVGGESGLVVSGGNTRMPRRDKDSGDGDGYCGVAVGDSKGNDDFTGIDRPRTGGGNSYRRPRRKGSPSPYRRHSAGITGKGVTELLKSLKLRGLNGGSGAVAEEDKAEYMDGKPVLATDRRRGGGAPSTARGQLLPLTATSARPTTTSATSSANCKMSAAFRGAEIRGSGVRGDKTQSGDSPYSSSSQRIVRNLDFVGGTKRDAW